MAEDDRLRFALTLIKDRLHKAVGDKRCGCGQCSHWIAVAAQRSGVTRERLEGGFAAAGQAGASALAAGTPGRTDLRFGHRPRSGAGCRPAGRVGATA